MPQYGLEVSRGISMAYSTITVRKLNPLIGAEIGGVDLTQPLSPDQTEEIRDAWLQHLVIVFRDQQLTAEQHVGLGKYFGDLHIHPAPEFPLPHHPEILVIHADENSTRVAGEEWHSDVSCEPRPPMGSMLHMTLLPADEAGDTLFANMYLAYETLPERIKALINGLIAVHDGAHVFDRNAKSIPHAEHPVVRTHPETGRKALFVNRVFTTRILGLSRSQSDAILEMLYRHIETPEFQFRLRWRPNTLACWDNRCTQHRALFDYFPQHRHGHRVTIAGDRPFFDQDAHVAESR